MKKFAKKGILLFAGAMAACALVLPAAASAASWGAVGSNHTLTSNNIGFSAAPGLTATCIDVSFSSNVTSAAALTITTATFAGCTSSLPALGSDCTMTWTPTRLPWRATAVSTTSIQIHDISFDIRWDDVPGRSGSCGQLSTVTSTITGTLSGGHWTGNGAGQHEVLWTFGTGLTFYSHYVLPIGTWFWVGTLRDTSQSLVIT